eukprot:CAMPEP_0196571760 /NCGR_PEP_ID=MMETSP1081-20130531/1886_1 /TAXON_ID=36882 /ORGANISM="Pyramimonas amylifera, Strain CCMP720" /LENGTH=59 /DNA_ID=CAMNT_0041888817 /DNA_START=543 /DNA_END=722 /DNA_ORIENTATION=+
MTAWAKDRIRKEAQLCHRFKVWFDDMKTKLTGSRDNQTNGSYLQQASSSDGDVHNLSSG